MTSHKRVARASAPTEPPGRRLAVHPYPALIGAAYVLAVVYDNDVSVWSAVRPLIIVIVTGFGLGLIGYWIARDRDRGSMLGLLGIVALARGADVRLLLLPLAAAAVVVLEAWLARRGPGRALVPWPGVSRVLDVVSAITVGLLISQIAASGLGPAPQRDPAWEAAAPAADASLPNIYLVLLDGHGRSDVLASEFGLDMSTFHGSLDALGFDVASGSRANYMATRYTLASMLNGAHLTDLGVDPEDTPGDPLLSRATTDSAAFRLADRFGYEIVTLSGGWDVVAIRAADSFRDLGLINELENTLLYNSGLVEPAFALEPDFNGVAVRTRVRRTMDDIAALARTTGASPRLVFAHLPVPHDPAVYLEDCEPRPVGRLEFLATSWVRDLPTGSTLDALIEQQRAQTACVDRLIVAVLEQVVATDKGAAIIVFSDHGPPTFLSDPVPDERGMRIRLANLFAARTPGYPELFPDDVTLVNVLPILFNAYLGVDLPLRPDDTYFGLDADDGLHLVRLDR